MKNFRAKKHHTFKEYKKRTEYLEKYINRLWYVLFMLTAALIYVTI